MVWSFLCAKVSFIFLKMSPSQPEKKSLLFADVSSIFFFFFGGRFLSALKDWKEEDLSKNSSAVCKEKQADLK